MPPTKGNINLYSRPRVVNPDGSISTVRSMSFEDDGDEVLVPTVEDHGHGILEDEAAIEQYRRTGQHLGKFNSPDEATAFAGKLHDRFENGLYDVPLATSRRSVAPAILERALLRLIRQR